MGTNDSPLLDREWRLNHIYNIVDKAGNRVPFRQNGIQKRLNSVTSKRRRILKSRQVGISTNELIRQLDFVLFSKNKTACILAHERDAIEKLFRIVRRAYEFMEDDIRPDLYKGGGSKYEMFFPSNNSRIYCDLSSRGDTINWLHISEAAFIEDPDNVKATIECVPMDGIITYETTPKGLNHFYDEWMDPDTNYENIFFPWYLHDEYKIDSSELTAKDFTDDEKKLIKYAIERYNIGITPQQIAYRRFKQSEQKKLFKQEYPEDDMSCFLSDGGAPFQLDIIKPMYDAAKPPIALISGIKIYKKYDPNKIYVLCADTSEGVNGDSSAAHVFEAITREQVSCFKSNTIKPSEFADKLIEMSDMYGKAYPQSLLGVERNNHGHAVLLKLDEIHNYSNLYRTRRENKKNDTEEIRLGWLTDKISRPLMIDIFIEGVENGSIILNDRETLGECLTLTNNEGKIEAEEGKHDDLFIAACIGIQMCIEESKLGIYSSSSVKT